MDTVSFASEPPDAEVIVDGRSIGNTPIRFPLSAKDPHYVEMRKDGYERQVFTIGSSVGNGWVILDIFPGIVLSVVPIIVDAASGAWKGLDEKEIVGRLRPSAVQAPLPDPVAKPDVHPTVPSTPRAAGPIVALFDVEDSAGLLDPAQVVQLTDYLAARVTESVGYRVVPRAQVRAALVDAKSQSYKTCFDESCQIELGRALAAEKSLATKVLRVGQVCAVTVAVFDLKTETTEKAATLRTECTQDALLSAVDQIAQQLAAPR